MKMLVTILSLGLLIISTSATEPEPIGDAHSCLISTRNGPLYPMTVLPGGGFDNLQNVEMSLVHDITYSQCQVSPDGKYLLPDSVFPISIQQSDLDYYSDFFDHWDNYTDLTSNSINAHASFFTAINGKFSSEYKDVKINQIEKKAKTTRTQVRHAFYTIRLKVGAKLHPSLEYHMNKNQVNLN